MPELPEVETVKEALNQTVKGQTIKEIELRYEPMIKNMSADEFKEKLINQTIQEVSRRGKYLVFHFDDYQLLSHLRMEGKYFYVDSDFELNPHVHVIFTLENGKRLLYQDTRKFGTYHLYDKAIDLETTAPFQVLGLEPFATEFTPSYVKEKIQNKKKPIKSLLLDQTVVCGLGNIYVDEVLYRARLHPLTSSSELTDKDIENVVKYTVEVLARAIELGGTTIRTFRSSHGVSGTFQNELLVHQRKGENCYECHTPIEKIKVGGRGTYFCPTCQKLTVKEMK
ncbi:DNA-formamidopyrimidine glycosylase [Turicibacter bilis]|uniref:DNA-formamidopyrimidine glycosylase n=1 Tax=Turicibacter TaxID=191303 RepID=UPI0007632382|nr:MULTISPECIES: DNA-formamidopyrimidine glycosylase [Turicibacter]AMC07958.1 DNA-formamidopyrimidine glycosylase [Turicibacter sp. H121]MBS3203336.1 DNA-formamidopyrimidine glycosylase [Turicibacter bilis]MCU7200515.1 DNA-formamidopyrimidine glycosylase [Turicibacter sp. H121]UUF10973.1 DNA-formamidopyrimidine glycosylase [Turicibacter bilis]